MVERLVVLAFLTGFFFLLVALLEEPFFADFLGTYATIEGMSLWFKGRFVRPILDGEKTFTVRRASSRLPKAGTVVRTSVGPRKPFAELRILSVEPVEITDLPPGYAEGLSASCFDVSDDVELVRIDFAVERILDVPETREILDPPAA